MSEPVALTTRERVEQAIRESIRRSSRGGRYALSTVSLMQLKIPGIDMAAAMDEMADEGLLERGAYISCYNGDDLWSGPLAEAVAKVHTKRCPECARPAPSENIISRFWSTTPALLAQMAPPPDVLTIGEVVDLLQKLPRADDVRGATALWALLGVAPP